MTAFEKWMIDNHEILCTRTVKEICEMAELCGFSRIEIIQWGTRENFRRAA